MKVVFESSRGKYNPSFKTNRFELMGIDIMIDENFDVWLIEINSNPGIVNTTPYLRQLLPRMIDDALKLTLDAVIKPPKNKDFKKTKVFSLESGINDQNEDDKKNLWVPILDLNKNKA